jgi:hypothetical protein
MTTVHARDVVLTRLEASRHRVMRSASLARASEVGHLKIVAPWVGCAGVEQDGREALVTPDQWSIYETTDSYAVANPVRVEHLIVMVPKSWLAERGLALDPLMARRLGGGGVARLALETVRSAYRELPGMSDTAARGVGDAITQFVHLAMLDLAGIGNAVTQREALRERIKQHVAEHLGDARLSVDSLAQALNCSRRQLYNAFSEEPDGALPATSCSAGWRPTTGPWTSATTTTARSPRSPSTSASRTWPTSAASSAATSACRPATTGAARARWRAERQGAPRRGWSAGQSIALAAQHLAAGVDGIVQSLARRHPAVAAGQRTVAKGLARSRQAAQAADDHGRGIAAAHAGLDGTDVDAVIAVVDFVEMHLGISACLRCRPGSHHAPVGASSPST